VSEEGGDWQCAFVGLGSNLGAREAQLEAAVAALHATPGIRDVVTSSVYETDPVDPGGPEEQGAYLNAVVRLWTSLAPHALLARLLEIERAAGRERGPVRHTARTLDLDLLLYGDCTIHSPDLSVPHPRMHERGFVLEPLRELAPDRVHPGTGRSIEQLAARVRDPAAVRRKHSQGGPPMTIAAVSISPVGEGTSVSRHVAAALRVAREQTRVRVRLDPMFTTLEGETRDIFELVQRMQEAVFTAGAERVGTVIKLDERRDRAVRMEDKLRSVEAALESDPD